MRLLSLFIGFLALIALIVALTIKPYEAKKKFSSFNDEWNGTSLLYSYLVNHGYAAKVLYSRLENLKGFEKGSLLIIIGNSSSYSLDEIAFLKNFVANGGKLLIADENPKLAESFGIKLSRGVLVDFQNYNKRQDLPLVRYSVPRVGNGVLALKFSAGILDYPENSKVLAASSKNSWIDIDKDKRINASSDLRGRFAVAVYSNYGNGSVIVISDSDLFTNDMLFRKDNLKFFLDLLNFLSKDKKPLIIFEEFRLEAKKSFFAAKFLSFLEDIKVENLSIAFMVFISLFYIFDKFSKTRKEAKEEVLTKPGISEFKALVKDVRKRLVRRYEPYNWIVIMKYRQLRNILLRYVPRKMRNEIDNETLVSIAYEKKKSFDRDELIHLLRACDNITKGKHVVKTLRETKLISEKLQRYVELLK